MPAPASRDALFLARRQELPLHDQVITIKPADSFIVPNRCNFVSCRLKSTSLASTGSYVEEQLLKRLAGGDEIAFNTIYEQYQQSVFAFSFYLTKSRELAEEVVQEVFVRVWEKREQLPESMTILPYIKRMAQNLVLDIYRKAGRDLALQQTLSDAMNTIFSHPEDQLQEKELRRIYREGIDQLPPQKKIIYTLHRDHQLSYEQIAAKLGLAPNTVRNHMTQAIRSVRDHVGKHGAILPIAMLIRHL